MCPDFSLNHWETSYKNDVASKVPEEKFHKPGVQTPI